MHSILIFGGTKKDREREIAQNSNTASINHPDIKIIHAQSGKSMGIEEVREIEKFLNTRPLKLRGKTVVILEAEKLTTQAQNALLKTLEEPPGNSKIILETKNENNLLPTIVSRCQRVNLGNKDLIDESEPEHNEQVKFFVELVKSSKGQRLDFIEINRQKITNKEYAINLLDIWISVLRDKMLLNTDAASSILNKKNKQLIGEIQLENDEIIKAIELAEEFRGNIQNTNTSIRLALELFLLNM